MEARNPSEVRNEFQTPPGAGPTLPTGSGSSGTLQPQQQAYSNRSTIDKMTEEERHVLKECERDSFYYRALPMSAGSMVGVQYLVKTGRLAPHPRLGAVPKAIIFGVFGYMIGKISYLPVCRQKILDQIPNSNLAATIRGRSENAQPVDNDATQFEGQAQNKTSDEYSAFNQNPSAIIESSVPPGIDDRFRPTVDKEVTNENEPSDAQKKTTYEEMRRRNRQQYEESQVKQRPKAPGSPSYKDSPLMPQKPWPQMPNKSHKPDDGSESLDPPAPAPPSQSRRKRTNMWGDVIED